MGTTRFALADGRPVVAWYPAAKDAADAPKETFDIASLLSPALQSKIPADKRPQYEIDAHPGAAPATGGPYPLVLFSHGFAAFPEQSADLVTHLSLLGLRGRGPEPRRAEPRRTPRHGRASRSPRSCRTSRCSTRPSTPRSPRASAPVHRSTA